MTSPAIKTASGADADRAIAVLVLAFSADPATRWAFPDPAQYLTYFPRFVRVFGGQAFDLGTADCAEDYAAAALWLPPDVHVDEEAIGEVVQQAVAPERLGEMVAVLGQMGRYHPTAPHWYLPLIGVDPTHQGQGYGSALLQHAHARCDRDGKLAYLESSNPANLPLYERYGFEVLDTIQAGASPTLWPMLRKPR
jgi:ribosomal protein S18 acetylase RimI-like enzyme